MEIDYLGNKYELDVGDIKNICQAFFEKRFNRAFNPIRDSYANEWLERFLRGYPWRYMDLQSRTVYIDLIKAGI